MTVLPSVYFDAIQAQAQNLAEAVADSANSAMVLEAAESHRGKIAERISALSTRREGVITRRNSGAHGPDDGANLALIQADMEGLTGLLPDAVARVTAAEAAYRADSAACARCREEVSRLEALAHLAALAGYAEALAAKLLEAIGNIAVVERQVGKSGPPAWRSPRALYEELRKLAAQTGEL